VAISRLRTYCAILKCFSDCAGSVRVYISLAGFLAIEIRHYVMRCILYLVGFILKFIM
jgi:hypothetical protein